MRRNLPAQRLIFDPQRSVDPDACQECGLAYSVQSDEDLRLHAQVHDEAVNGVPVPAAPGELIVSNYEQFEILKTENLSLLEHPAIGERLKRASSIANEETNYDFGIFDEDELERGGAIVVWASETQAAGVRRIVGLTVVDLRVELGRTIPTTDLSLAISGQNFGVDGTCSNVLGIRFVWVLRKHRGTGLAAALVESVFAELSGDWERIAFCYPFTPAGARLVYKLAKRASAPSIAVYK